MKISYTRCQEIIKFILFTRGVFNIAKICKVIEGRSFLCNRGVSLSADETTYHLLDSVSFHFVLQPIELEERVDGSGDQEETVVVQMTKSVNEKKNS